MELYGRKAHDIAAGTEVHFVLGVEFDIRTGNQRGVQIQHQGRETLHAPIRTGIVDLVKVVRITRLLCHTFTVALPITLIFMDFSVSLQFLDTDSPVQMEL